MREKRGKKREPTVEIVDDYIREWMKCQASPSYFVNTYCKIYDAKTGSWIPFKLWKEQMTTLDVIHTGNLTIVLKARQLGLTWLTLSYALWQMLFEPIATILIFSRRDDDAMYLLSNERLRGMYNNLPAWMKSEKEVVSGSHMWKLSNGSVARSFPTTGGDSYTATMVMVDEADLIPDLNAVLRSTKPTIDAGGKMVLISRVDKSTPESEFKRLYMAAKKGESSWRCVFLPWSIRTSRTKEWYEEQRRDILSRTGTLDDLWEQYPNTDEEALAPRSLDKRIPPEWLLANYKEGKRMDYDDLPIYIPNAIFYCSPVENLDYVLGVDPAEGNPNSDDSAITVLCKQTGEEVAHLSGKFEPAIIAHYANVIAQYYNKATILVERNNHGHATILWLQDNTMANVMNGWDGRPGWLSTNKGKALMYDSFTEALRHGLTTIRTPKSYAQLSTVEGSTLRAPKGQPDDCAMSYALAWQGCSGQWEEDNSAPLMFQAKVKGR